MTRSCLTGFFSILAVAVTMSSASAQDLRSSVQTALNSNPKIRAQDSAMRAAAYDLLEMRGAYLPTVSVFGTIGPEYVDDPAGLSVADNARTKNARELGLVARLPLFDGYRRANTVYTRAARLDRSMFEYLDASETMALTVVQSYIDVARHHSLLSIAQDHLNRHLEISRQVADQVAGGRLPLSDQLQVESRVEAVRITISELNREMALAKSRYRELVGKDPVSVYTVPGAPSLPASMEKLVSASIQNNFRVKRAQANVDSRQFERNLAESEYQPQLNLSVGGSVGADLDGSSGSENRAFVGLTLDWKVFNGGREERRRALAERKNEALYDRMAIIREVQQLAESSWASFQSNQRIANISSKQVALNRDLVDQYLVEFQLATRSLLDVLIAETELFGSRLEQINARAGASFSAYRMLATQSRLAQHFGVDSTGELLLLQVQATETQKPFSVIDKGQTFVKR